MPRANILIRPPQTRPSEGAQTLNEALGNQSRLSRRVPIPRQYTKVINWGNTQLIDFGNRLVYNQPVSILAAVDKVACLSQLRLAGVRVPEFKLEEPGAVADGLWLERHNLRGHSGSGIRVVRRGEEFLKAPLYVRYIPKLNEYRAHVAGGKVIFLQQKRRDREAEQTKDEKLIRSYDNGWVFCPLDLTVDNAIVSSVKELAVEAAQALTLDFGAVDIIYGRDDGLPYVLEINTAPGIHSPTLLRAYKEYFLTDPG